MQSKLQLTLVVHKSGSHLPGQVTSLGEDVLLPCRPHPTPGFLSRFAEWSEILLLDFQLHLMASSPVFTRGCGASTSPKKPLRVEDSVSFTPGKVQRCRMGRGGGGRNAPTCSEPSTCLQDYHTRVEFGIWCIFDILGHIKTLLDD